MVVYNCFSSYNFCFFCVRTTVKKGCQICLVILASISIFTFLHVTLLVYIFLFQVCLTFNQGKTSLAHLGTSNILLKLVKLQTN